MGPCQTGPYRWLVILHYDIYNIDGLVQDYSNPIALAIELLQSCTKP